MQKTHSKLSSKLVGAEGRLANVLCQKELEHVEFVFMVTATVVITSYY